jgi:DnaJ-class molecular chaperone
MSIDKFKSRTFYELLGVRQDASTEEIKRAFRDISRIYDPSSNFYADLIDDPPKPRDIEIFKLVSTAYETLIDEGKRRAYDSSLDSEYSSAAAYAVASSGTTAKRHIQRSMLLFGFGLLALALAIAVFFLRSHAQS